MNQILWWPIVRAAMFFRRKNPANATRAEFWLIESGFGIPESALI
jgi:hypothetical protein